MIRHEKRNKIWLGLVLVLLLLIVNITWWPSFNLISGLDWSYTGFSGEQDFKRNIYTWNEDQFWGVGNFFNTALLPWDAIFFLGEALSLSPHFLERVLFSLFIITAGFGIWHLLHTIHKKTSALMIAVVVFYVANFLTIILWHNQLIFLLLTYAMLPWFMSLYIRLLEDEHFSPWGFILLTLILSPAVVNPPTILGIIILPLAVYSFFFILKNIRRPKESRRWLIRNVVIVLTTAALHAWWLLPALYGSQQFTDQPPITEVSASLDRNTQHLTLGNLLNFGGHWSLYENNLAGQPYFHFGPQYTSASSPLTYLGYVFSLLAVLALLRHGNLRRKSLWIWPALAVIFLFLAKGPNDPLGRVFRWLTEHLPIFWAFRSPEYKFLPVFVLCLAVLISFHFRPNAQKEKKRNSRINAGLAAVIITITLVHAYPFFTGTLFEKRHADVVDARKKYADWIEWSSKQAATTSLYILPQQDGAYLTYNWGYEGLDFAPHIINLPAGGVKGGIIYAKELAGMINGKIFRTDDVEKVARYLAETGTDYIVQRNDVDNSVYPKHLFQSSPENLRDFLPTIPGVMKERSFGDWDLYSFKNSRETVRAASQAVFWTGPASTFDDILTRQDEEEGKYNVYASIPSEENTTIPYGQYYQKIMATDGRAIIKNEGWIMKPKENPEGLAVTGLDSYPENKLEYRFTVPEKNNYTIEILIHYGSAQSTLAYELDHGQKGTLWPHDGSTENPFDFRYAFLFEAQELSAGEHVITFVNQEPFNGKGIQEIRHIVVKTAERTVSKETPQITSTRKSPTHWQVTVSAAEQPFYLIFGQTYHPGWMVSGDGGERVSNDSHFIAQAYANGWYMEQTGNYTLDIIFWPQRLLIVGTVVSCLSLISMLIVGLKFRRNH